MSLKTYKPTFTQHRWLLRIFLLLTIVCSLMWGLAAEQFRLQKNYTRKLEKRLSSQQH